MVIFIKYCYDFIPKIQFLCYELRWEDEYYAAYKKNSGLLHLSELDKEEEQIEKLVVKSSNPESFVKAITTSADKLLGIYEYFYRITLSDKIKLNTLCRQKTVLRITEIVAFRSESKVS